MNVYPIQVELSQERPKQFQRLHVLLRLLFLIMLGGVVQVTGGLMGVFYFVLPGITAVLLTQHGAAVFLKSDSSWLIKGLRWYLACAAYLGMLTDNLPAQDPSEVIRVEVRLEGNPTIGSALSRMFYSIPSFLVLGLLSCVGALVWVIAALCILLTRDYPATLYRFLQGLLFWQARLLAYHASLIEQYPPFSLEVSSSIKQSV
jgi:hypothetical protein